VYGVTTWSFGTDFGLRRFVAVTGITQCARTRPGRKAGQCLHPRKKRRPAPSTGGKQPGEVRFQPIVQAPGQQLGVVDRGRDPSVETPLIRPLAIAPVGIALAERGDLVGLAGGQRLRVRTARVEPAQALAQAYVWAPGATLELPGGLLSARPTTGRGLRASLAQAGLSVRPRRGGETLLPAGWPHTVSVKQLLQQHGVPPWERAQLPLVWADEQLVAVADLCVAAEAAAGPGESGFELVYRR